MAQDTSARAGRGKIEDGPASGSRAVDMPRAGEPCDENCGCSPMDEVDAYFERLLAAGEL